ncbi:hypothetical protein [Thalassospira sp.]|uniref:hypothetical protein n=1 Tax=Thalassospira sp. TaxID=1912094 RepID=UPI002736BFE7|nr:hypothetical protein [Thalassospira sp.]MDP2700151.1 hypothetical protein [Thalassospira sp.]
MKFKTKDGLHSFEITPQGAGLIGIFDGDAKQESSLEFTYTLSTSDDKFSKIPEGWIAQDGYMTTNPKQAGLGYMMTFAGATMATQSNVANVFISSGSVAGGGQALITALGGEQYDLVVAMKDGTTDTFAGYAIPVAEMLEKSQQGWLAKGWELVDSDLS